MQRIAHIWTYADEGKKIVRIPKCVRIQIPGECSIQLDITQGKKFGQAKREIMESDLPDAIKARFSTIRYSSSPPEWKFPSEHLFAVIETVYLLFPEPYSANDAFLEIPSMWMKPVSNAQETQTPVQLTQTIEKLESTIKEDEEIENRKRMRLEEERERVKRRMARTRRQA